MENNLHHTLKLFSEELGYQIQQGDSIRGYTIFYIDLSAWRLRLNDRTPIIWVKKSDLENNSASHLLESLQDVSREGKLRRHTVLVLMDGDSSPLRKIASPRLKFVIIGKTEQDEILKSRRPTGVLLDLISEQVSISNLSPYEIGAPVTGSRFFGREYERDWILSNPDTNFLVLGIRRIGKTSLLKEVERIFKEDQVGGYIRYFDCSDLLSTHAFVREVVRKLYPKELPRLEYQKYVFYFPDFLERMQQRYKGKIILLMDEIDNLVIMQQENRELFRMLRTAANTGSCQFIIAGFREVMREQHKLNSPLYQYFHELRLSEFTRKQAHEMIVRPLENLRVRIHDLDQVVRRIYDETGGHPNLIQYYCMVLLRHLDLSGKREISPDSLIDVYTDEGFKNHLLTSFLENTGNREKTIVYSLLREADESRLGNVTQAYMDAVLRKLGIVLKQRDMDNACETLILAGVLHRKGREYSFTSPVFSKVLQQTYSLDHLLNKAKEEGYE